VLRQWDPEHQLIGALMHLSAPAAATILDLVPDHAIGHPDNRWALEIIRALVTEGRHPDPVLVLHTARHQGPTDAAHPGEPVTPGRHHRLAVHLAALYTQTVTPAATAQYAREVLDDAYRRAVGFHGIRMQQLAETGASRDDLTDYLTAMRADLADLWRRAQAAGPSMNRTA
jgi:replicative DNA helicase